MKKNEIREKTEDLLLFSDPQNHDLLHQLAKEKGVSVDALMELLAFMRENQIKLRLQSITETCDDVFDNQTYWGAE